MREIRTSGSVEGVLSNGHPYSDSHSASTPKEVTAWLSSFGRMKADARGRIYRTKVSIDTFVQ